jgi:hypothetical protein
MKFIAHRINTIEELRKIPTDFGVEIDVRDFGSELVIQHDPFKGGELLEEYLKNYKHGKLILNIKSEGIELKILELLKKYQVKDYFFLDSSFPMIYFLASQGERNIALRFSELEGLDTLREMRGKVEWVWIDCFTRLPLTQQDFKQLKEWGYKLCLVSPELQGREADIAFYNKYLRENKIVMDAVCTKVYNTDKWSNV